MVRLLIELESNYSSCSFLLRKTAQPGHGLRREPLSSLGRSESLGLLGAVYVQTGYELQDFGTSPAPLV